MSTFDNYDFAMANEATIAENFHSSAGPHIRSRNEET
jgi:hypothetical protein